MDDMTWMSSFYEPPPEPSERQPALAFWMAAALLVALGCGGAVLVAWSHASAPAGPMAAYAGPVP